MAKGTSTPATRQAPLRLQDAAKRDVRTQFAALCWRMHKDKPQVLLITSRGTQRWILPKGWPMPDRTPAETALQEAWEEAGVEGRVQEVCLGLYSYDKEVSRSGNLPCLAMVFPVEVRSLAANFPEKNQRKRRWFGRKKAAAAVDDPELAQIIRHFDPAPLRR